MSSKLEILDYLSLPENIDIALEIADYVGKLQETSFGRFWERFYLKLNEKALAHAGFSAWRLDNKKENEVGSWTIYSRILQPGYPEKSLSLCFGVYAKENFYWGMWKKQISEVDLPDPLFQELRMILTEWKITNFGSQSWISWSNYTKHRMKSAKFLSSMMHEGDAIVSEVVDDFWQLFLQCQSLMEQINQKTNSNG